MTGRRLAPVLFGLVLAACGNTAPSGQPTQPTAMPGTGAPASALPGDSRLQSGPPGAFIEGPGELVLGDLAFGLDAIGSHTSTLVEAFEGSIGGSAAAWTVTTTLEVDADAAARSLTVTITGSLPEGYAEAGRTVLAGGVLYHLDENGCTGALADEAAASSLGEPGALLRGLIGASAAGSETINGVAVDSYAFDGLALGFAAAAASGRVSLATADQHVVRYAVEERGGADFLGEDWDGTITTSYDVASGGPGAMDLPADCPAGVIAFAVPTEATAVTTQPGRISFRLTGSVGDAVAVVRGGSVLARWSAGGSEIGKASAHLSFTTSDLAIDAYVSTVDGGTLVELFAART